MSLGGFPFRNLNFLNTKTPPAIAHRTIITMRQDNGIIVFLELCPDGGLWIFCSVTTSTVAVEESSDELVLRPVDLVSVEMLELVAVTCGARVDSQTSSSGDKSMRIFPLLSTGSAHLSGS